MHFYMVLTYFISRQIGPRETLSDSSICHNSRPVIVSNSSLSWRPKKLRHCRNAGSISRRRHPTLPQMTKTRVILSSVGIAGPIQSPASHPTDKQISTDVVTRIEHVSMKSRGIFGDSILLKTTLVFVAPSDYRSMSFLSSCTPYLSTNFEIML